MKHLLALAGVLLACSNHAETNPETPAFGGAAGVPMSSGGSTAGMASTAGQAPMGGAGDGGKPTAVAGAAGAAGASAGLGGAEVAGAGGTKTSAQAGASGSAGTIDPSQLPKLTLHLAGDSTVMNYAADSAQEGWGQELPGYFGAKVTFNNQAQGGASVETFYTGRWKNLIGAVRAGDYVLAAFGANDSGTVAGRHVEPPDFQARYAVMADEVKAKQATFLIVTPSALQEWSGGKAGNNRLGPYVAVLHTLAETKQLPLVDLNARSLELLSEIGQTAAQDIYLDGDKAHFTKQGATKMAELFASELKKMGSPLAAYLR